jgi:hypothetical protein
VHQRHRTNHDAAVVSNEYIQLAIFEILGNLVDVCTTFFLQSAEIDLHATFSITSRVAGVRDSLSAG